MGTPYPLEKKNQILGRILCKEITVEQAHREYSIATSCVYRWLGLLPQGVALVRFCAPLVREFSMSGSDTKDILRWP